jgi:hypothetical protein
MPERTGEFAKDEDYEILLEEANEKVRGWGEEEGAVPRGPILFVVGLPRSGSTLLYQILAATGGFLYPTNLLARFYRAPAWGARMQRLLEPLLSRGEDSFTSRAGNTEGWWGVHEFGYFWEYHFRFRDHHEPASTALDSLASALAALEKEAGGRPLLFKSNLLAFVLDELARAIPTARFLWISRNSLDVADSIYRTRMRYYGDPGTWWSLRPADVPDGASPAVAIAHQIARGREGIVRSRDAVAGSEEGLGDRFAEVRYEDLCRRPRAAIRTAQRLLGVHLDPSGLPDAFSPSEARVSNEVRRELETALRQRGLAI